MKLKKIFFIFIFLLLFSFLIIKNTFAADKIMDGISDTTENIYSSNSTFTCGSTLTDSRDKKTYATIQVGNTCWLKSNLNYGTTCNYECFIKASKYCYGNTDSNCNVYGGLYDYEQAKSACPTGWTLPTSANWTAVNTAANLAAIGFTHYGQYLKDVYTQLNSYGVYWDSVGTAHYKAIVGKTLSTYVKSAAEGRRHAVRCVRSAEVVLPTKIPTPTLIPTFTCGSTLTDSRDKKTYATIQVGNTCWLKSNLNYGTTCNYECFIKASKYCYGNTDSNCNVYGGLYDYEQAKSACPTGWSLPTDDDWNVINTKDNLNRINFQHFGEYLSNYQQLNTYGFYWSNIGTNYYKGISDSNLATHSVSMKEGRRLSVKCVKNK